MKKITSAVLGLSMALATAGMTFAGQDASTNPQATANSTPAPAKKHVRKHKKANKTTVAPSAAPTAAPNAASQSK